MDISHLEWGRHAHDLLTPNHVTVRITKKSQQSLTESVEPWQPQTKRARDAQAIIYNLAALFYYGHLYSPRFVSHLLWHFKQKHTFLQFSFWFSSAHVMSCHIKSCLMWRDMGCSVTQANQSRNQEEPGRVLDTKQGCWLLFDIPPVLWETS